MTGTFRYGNYIIPEDDPQYPPATGTVLNEQQQYLQDMKNSRLWQCEFCKVVNPMSNNICGEDKPYGCGALKNQQI